jgi:hypothetical protein
MMLFKVTKYRRIIQGGNWTTGIHDQRDFTAPDWTRAIRSIDPVRFISPHSVGTLYNNEGNPVNDTESRVVPGTKWVSRPIRVHYGKLSMHIRYEIELVSRYIN